MDLKTVFKELALNRQYVTIFIQGNDTPLMGVVTRCQEDFFTIERREGMHKEFQIPFSSVAYFQIRK